MKTTALQAATAASIAAILLLSGCSLLPSIPDFGGGDSSSDNGSDNDSDGGGLDDDEIEENPFLDNQVPEGFPSDVPLPDLEIYLGLSTTEDSWAIIYKADDLESDFGDVVDMFEGDGWETMMNNSSADGALGVFEKDQYTVQVIGVADGESDFDGPGISMTVVRTA